jgi:hypothetical protein
MKQIPTVVTTVDPKTGKETHAPASMTVMPPRPGACTICATAHNADEPHNAQSIYYQTISSMIGRPATWADAMAHCSEDTRAAWRAELERRGFWSEPPEGEQPVAHHGEL